MDDLTPVLVCAVLFIGLPWIIFHYITKWKQAPKMTDEDEKLLDEMYNLARRLEDRVNTVERIVAADHPDWKPLPPAKLLMPADAEHEMPIAARNVSSGRFIVTPAAIVAAMGPTMPVVWNPRFAASVPTARPRRCIAS